MPASHNTFFHAATGFGKAAVVVVQVIHPTNEKITCSSGAAAPAEHSPRPIHIPRQFIGRKRPVNPSLQAPLFKFGPTQPEQLRRLTGRKSATLVVIKDNGRRDRVVELTALAFREGGNIFRQRNGDCHGALDNAKLTEFRKALLQRGRALAGAEISQTSGLNMSLTQLQRGRAPEGAEKIQYISASCFTLAAVKTPEQSRAEESACFPHGLGQRSDSQNDTCILAGCQDAQAAYDCDSLLNRQPPRRQVVEQCRLPEVTGHRDGLRFAATKPHFITCNQRRDRCGQIHRFQHCAARHLFSQNSVRGQVFGRHFRYDGRRHPDLGSNPRQQIESANGCERHQDRAIADDMDSAGHYTVV